MRTRRGGNRDAEEVRLNVAAGLVKLLPSRYEPSYRDREPIACWVVRAWEPQPPANAEALERLLCTSLPCEEPTAALFVAEGYSLRWLIEEFHKAEKTGCSVALRRLEHTDRLEPRLGLLSVLAVWLLELKFVARAEPDRSAGEVYDPLAVRVMAKYLKRSAERLTVARFRSGIGRLSGDLGRKRDGPVGRLRAWRGWESFQLILLGATLGADGRDAGNSNSGVLLPRPGCARQCPRRDDQTQPPPGCVRQCRPTRKCDLENAPLSDFDRAFSSPRPIMRRRSPARSGCYLSTP